ncbi:uncharacterized protein LOC128213022 [Mya arenaria]|uniref:uncharacterized protein LOC128213022 n=1 Tax=Mya arenaria TaxID=6604 RepID=UPI0022E6DD96|nr:uncharacterized protein LOC128213022 [Mya arenaria]
MIRIVVLCVIAVCYAGATTTTQIPKTTHPHVTHEPSEHENFKFFYEPHTHQLVVLSGPDCYVFPLSDTERTSVHTDTGFRALELKSLALLNTGTKTPTTKDQLDNRVARVCGNHATSIYMVS